MNSPPPISRGEADTPDYRENPMPATGRLGPGSGILRHCDTQPEATQIH
jgi:hypothetical protein